MAIFTTLRGEIHNSIQQKLQNSMEVDSVGIIAIPSMLYITTRIVKTQTSVAKIPRVPVENQITTLSVITIAIQVSPCTLFTYVLFTKYCRQKSSLNPKIQATLNLVQQHLQGGYHISGKVLSLNRCIDNIPDTIVLMQHGYSNRTILHLLCISSTMN